MTNHNIPLDSFPSEQLKQICIALAHLPKGTAEGCREPLVYARNRLPAIRREHVLPTKHRTAADDDSQPLVSRGERLDQQLTVLLASVATALDQYQTELRSKLPDAVEQETAVDPARISSFPAVISKSEALDPVLEEAIVSSSQLAGECVPSADQLGRQLTDAKTHNQTARAEAQMPTVRVSWYQAIVAKIPKIGEHIERTGEVIEKIADGIETVDNASKPLRDFWSKAKRKQFKHAVEMLRDVGQGFKSFGQELTALQNKSASPANRPDDFDLEKVHEMILAGQEPRLEWRPWIKKLDFLRKDLSNLAPPREPCRVAGATP